MIDKKLPFIKELLKKQQPAVGVSKEQHDLKVLFFMRIAWNLFLQFRGDLLEISKKNDEENVLIEECFLLSSHVASAYFKLKKNGLSEEEIDEFTDSMIAEWIGV